MIIFLYGPDDYRREQKKREIVAEFQKKRSDLGVGRFDLTDIEQLGKFGDFLASQSLFQPKKLAVLAGLFDVFSPSFAKATEGKDFVKQLQGVLDNKDITVLISEGEKPVKALEFLRKEPVLTQDFEYLEGKEWESFILKKAKELEVKLDLGAVKFLAEVYAKNTWGLVTELEKVSFLNREVLTTRDFEEFGLERAPNFWGLMMGFKSRSLDQRLWALEKVFGSSEPAAKTFNILAYQLPGRLGEMAKYDLLVKSGKLEYEEALVDLMI